METNGSYRQCSSNRPKSQWYYFLLMRARERLFKRTASPRAYDCVQSGHKIGHDSVCIV
jgi:hypothetical protein